MKERARSGPAARSAAWRGAGVAAAAAAVLVLATACGEGGDDGSATPSIEASVPGGLPTGLLTGLPTELPSGIPTALPTDLSFPDVSGTDIPNDFPIPPGAKAEVRSVGGGDALSLTGVSAEDANAFYRDALPKAGYEIVTDTAGGPLPGGISFSGNDVSGTIAGVDVAGQSAVLVTFAKIN